MSDDDHAHQLQMARQRLHVLQTVVDALERRDEISAVISASPNFATAAGALAELLDTDEAGAHAVLTLHWSSFTSTRRQQARDDLTEMKETVSTLESQ